MADGSAVGSTSEIPTSLQVLNYIEQIVLELAGMAADAGETALAASLAITAIQAGAAKARPSD